MIVGLDLHQDVDRLVAGLVAAATRLREPAAAGPAFDHRGVVAVGRQHALRAAAVRVADHAEQRLFAARAVDDPVGVEDLVPAVLRVRLREHHQLDVGRIAFELVAERGDEVVDLVVGQRETQCGVRGFERRTALREHRHRRERLGFVMREQPRRGIHRLEHALGHAVVDDRGNGRTLRAGQRRPCAHVIGDAAFDADDAGEPADVRDVGRLGRPGRDRAEARHHQQQLPLRLPGLRSRAVAQQRLDDARLCRRQWLARGDEVQVAGLDRGHVRHAFADGSQDLVETEIRERGSAAESEHERGRPPFSREPGMIPERPVPGQHAAT